MNTDKVAILTAAGSGMGAACARRLAAEGYKVAILSSSGKGQALAEQLGGWGVTGSNQSPDDLARLVDGVLARWGRIDVLVNSAGHGPKGPILELSDADWQRGMDTYLFNVIRPTRLVVPAMRAQGGGAIVNISSAWAQEPAEAFPTSAVFRAGLAAFAKLFADQHAAAGIRMNNVLPGWIETYPVGPDLDTTIPAGRAGTADEVAKAVAFLVSDDASYINGQSLRVDGGLMRSI